MLNKGSVREIMNKMLERPVRRSSLKMVFLQGADRYCVYGRKLAEDTYSIEVADIRHRPHNATARILHLVASAVFSVEPSEDADDDGPLPTLLSCSFNGRAQTPVQDLPYCNRVLGFIERAVNLRVHKINETAHALRLL